MPEENDPVIQKHRDLERIAMVALRAAQLFTQSGAKVKVVHEGSELIVKGLGVNFVGGRAGYASHEITVSSGVNTITRMITVGPHGVNQRLDYALRRLCLKVAKGGMSVDQVSTAIEKLVKRTPHWGPKTVALFVGIACAAFGQLLGIDWAATLPVFIAATLGQYLRQKMIKAKVNMYIIAAVIAFIASLIGGAGARQFGSETTSLSMMASILLLVPGIPATNAQTDIMDGYPAMGSARAISVCMVMIFATVGVWISGSILGIK